MSFTKRVPKTELHVHVEALVQLETLKELARKYNLSQGKVEKLEQAAQTGYENIVDFFEYWHLLNESLQSPEDFERVCYEYLSVVSEYNTKYVELNINVLRQKEKGIDVSKIIEAMYSAEKQAEKHFGIISRTLLSFSRDFSIGDGKYIVNLAYNNRDKNVCGIDIAGNEKVHPNHKFFDVFKYAKQKNISRAAHAGEGAKQNSVKSAVVNLGASRIGHGVDAGGDDPLQEIILDRNVCIELCVSSNVALKVSDSIENHPGKDFIQKGIPVTINTDDPTLLGISLQDEYNLLTEAWDLSERDLIQIYKNGVQHSFAEADIKKELLQVV